MTNNLCLQCDGKFKPKKNSSGYEKRNMKGSLYRTEETVLSALKKLQNYKGPEEGYICTRCFIKLQQLYRKANQTTAPPAKRKCLEDLSQDLSPIRSSPTCQVLFHRTTTKRPVVRSSKKKIPKKGIDAISNNLKKSKYATALRLILARGKNAKEAFQQVVAKTIRVELRAFNKTCKDYPVLKGAQSIANFRWQNVLDLAAEEMPILYQMLEASMSVVSQKETNHRTSVLPRIGMMLSIILYSVNPRKFQFLQAVTGIQLWRCGASAKLQRGLNLLGVCQRSCVTKRNINQLCHESEAQLLQWKHELEDPRQTDSGEKPETSQDKTKKKRAKKTDCSLVVKQEEMMLEFLQENPVIWNCKITDYRGADKKRKMWDDQAALMGKTSAHLQEWFKSLRDTHNRLDKESGDGAPDLTQREQWIKDKFGFLKSVVRHRPGPCNSVYKSRPPWTHMRVT